MKVLITGARGLLGPYLVEEFDKRGHEVIETWRGDCDLTNRARVKDLLTCNPEVIVHAAAETDIDYCEKDPLNAIDINRDTTYLLAGLCPSAKFVYISTDMVYRDVRGPHRENETGPVNMYGRSKLSGESCARINQRHLICRTNFFGASRTPGRLSFSDWVIKGLTEGPTPTFFNNVLFNPLHMETLSSLICELTEQDVIGIFNLGASTTMSKAAFAGAVAERKGLFDEFNKAALAPANYNTPRPLDLSMDCTKITKRGWVMPSLESEIKKL